MSAKFDEYLSLYLKENCTDGKVNVRNEINISYLVSHLSLQHVSVVYANQITVITNQTFFITLFTHQNTTQ